MNDIWTRQQGTMHSQIDYIFFSKSIKAENAKAVKINNDICIISDHRPVIADATWPKRLRLQSLVKIKSNTGWKPSNHEEAIQFQTETLQLFQQHLSIYYIKRTIVDITNEMYYQTKQQNHYNNKNERYQITKENKNKLNAIEKHNLFT